MIKRFLFYLTILLLVCFFPAAGWSQCSTYSSHGVATYNHGYSHSNYAAVYTPPVVALQFQPYLVPTYAVGYIGAAPAVQQQQHAAPTTCDTSALKAEIKELKDALKQLAQPQVPAFQSRQQQYVPQDFQPQYQQPQQQYAPQSQQQNSHGPTSYQSILKNRCAMCHDKSTSNKGDGLVLIDGDQVVPLNVEQAAAVFSAGLQGRMPKRPHLPLNAEEVGSLAYWFAQMQQQTKK